MQGFFGYQCRHGCCERGLANLAMVFLNEHSMPGHRQWHVRELLHQLHQSHQPRETRTIGPFNLPIRFRESDIQGSLFAHSALPESLQIFDQYTNFICLEDDLFVLHDDKTGLMSYSSESCHSLPTNVTVISTINITPQSPISIVKITTNKTSKITNHAQ